MNTNAGDARSLRNPSVSKSCGVGRCRGDGVQVDEFRLSKTCHLGDPQLAARPEDSISFVHDVARRRGRQLVRDEGEHHEILRGVGERQRSRIGTRVGDARVVRDNVYPRGILALAKLREPPRHRQHVRTQVNADQRFGVREFCS